MIQSTSNLTGYPRADIISSLPSPKAPPAKLQSETGDHLSSANTDNLRAVLAQTQEIRPEVVARGKALAIDGSYPPRHIIESLAKLLTQSRDLSAND